jgi:hypothetical protein
MCESVLHKWRALNLERAGDAGNELLDSEARFCAASLSESSSEPGCDCMLHSNLVVENKHRDTSKYR